MNRFLLFFGLSFFLWSNVAKAQPCNFLPTPGTVYNGSSMVYCPSQATNLWLYVSGQTMGTGVTYQWQVAPLGTVQWYNITGQNTDTLSLQTDTMTNGFLLRVAVSCNSLTSYTPSFTIPGPAANCQDSVWPGDVNYDLIANNLDALDLATAIGSTGSVRPGATINWNKQFSKDWFSSFTGGGNHKNADCNGDGIVDISDTLAIYNNYGMVHLKQGPRVPQLKTTADPDLYFDLTGISMVAGSTVSIPIKLGNATYPMNNIYGLAASIKLDGITLNAPINVTYNASWLGNTAGTLRFSKSITNNQLDWAYARTDKQNISGNGTIATVTFTIPATSSGQGILYFDKVKMINNTGTAITAVNIVDDTLQVIPVGISETKFQGSEVAVVPNPSSSAARILFTLVQPEAVKLEVINTLGEKVWERVSSANSGEQSVNLPSTLAAGVYMIKLSSSTSAASVKWIKNY